MNHHWAKIILQFKEQNLEMALYAFAHNGLERMGGNMNIVCWQRGERGFTLIEMLLVLSFLLLLLFFFPSLMKTVVTGYEFGQDPSRDVTVFFNHLSIDVREAIEVETGPNSLIINKGPRELYLVELISSKQIRRLRNGAGHVLMLEQVESFSCQAMEQLVRCEVELASGKKVSRSMVMLYPVVSEEG